MSGGVGVYPIKNMEKKIIVAHPGRQHSFRLATALKNKGILYKYLTTVYYKDTSCMLSFIDKCTFGKLTKSITTRRCEFLNDDDIVQYYSGLALVTLLLVRLNNGGKLYHWWNDFVTDLFGRRVAKYAMKNCIDVVIMYDTTADECFRVLNKKAPNIKLVIDSAAACNEYVIRTFEEDMATSSTSKVQIEAAKFWDKTNRRKLALERKLANSFLVPSTYCRMSLENYIEDDTNVFVIPYGSNFRVERKESFFDKKRINFIFVGQVSYRKGAHYLLDAFKYYSDSSNVVLHMVGMYDSDQALYKEYCGQKNIIFYGLVDHDTVRNLLKICDVMIIPSLSEGMTLAGLEGMSLGLPLICTRNSGVNDFITDYQTGITIDVLNTNAIQRSIQWFIENKGKVPQMADAVIKVASINTWERYYERMGDLFLHMS